MTRLSSSLASAAAAAALYSSGVSAQKLVFAHVVVGDTASHNQSTWENDIKLASAAAIDAFALNGGYPDSNIPIQVANAFAACEALDNGFKLFFSFDYLGGGQPWPATGDNSVASYLANYTKSSCYQNYNNLPFVSTFEGTKNIDDWAPGGSIRSAAGDVYFVPDWTSLGTSGITAHLDNIEGFFSWNMWPDGANNLTDDGDKAWQSAIGSKSYMMGVSPWFFHSGSSSGTNWVWRGDDLWADRWQEVFDVDPQFVEIVTWNDWGEASYIGPFVSDNEVPTTSAPYVDNMPHESFRDFLPYYIATFKGSNFTISKDQMQYWYRLAPAAGGSACGVDGNDPDQGQTEVDPNTIVQDKVFFSALLTSAATVQVQIGSNSPTQFDGSQGLNHFSQPFNGQTGEVTFSIIRNGETVGNGTGAAITSSTSLSNGCTNYNAWAGSF
ncbi:putative glucan endo-1,3-alpha-glucosidase agn1 precursor [Talaromyces proteolyticus]|uniref:Glucan endo-1,3-alpha-glucosidase agn1 n=1 Tax=Talaromyces proteolyticus TaxID=1131652 RepID=A0AAD4KEZ5_9EURO|nr:putative glucan endo-1,3-alpha-glucosidase agn1 precursor [Talaromyces proteolyticus]KAH8689532.1 putative glucan endo-1,3-alpha-glucosidase agn1 precursor [Talaromyces proteolyticus]